MVVGEIWRYPVKSMGGEPLRETVLIADGIPGDRVVHGAARRLRSLMSTQIPVHLAAAIEDAGSADARAANPFRLARLHLGIGSGSRSPRIGGSRSGHREFV